jgi:hypothetical protein
MCTYRYLYPFDDASLAQIAYYFDFDYVPEGDPTGYAAEVVSYVYEWKSNPELGTLRSVMRADGSMVLLDTRSDATISELVLSGLEQAAYEFCDELRAGPSIVRHLRASFPLVEFSDSRLFDFLESLVQHRLMVTDGVNYLSLAIRTQPIEVEPRRAEPITFGPGPLRSASSYLRAELKVLQA